MITKGRFDAAFLDGNLHGHPVDEVASSLTRTSNPFVFVSGYGREPACQLCPRGHYRQAVCHPTRCFPPLGRFSKRELERFSP